jgi:8-oxo-dGTP pyrophosphatase MutT (NUDIX family)
MGRVGESFQRSNVQTFNVLTPGSATISAVLSIDSFRAGLAGFSPRVIADREGYTQSAVAAILHPADCGTELLFIHRAEDPRDPWSGHMAFPGGRLDASDDTTLAAALRETREEIGLDLERTGESIGRLSDVSAVGRGRPVSMVITPFVFVVEDVPPLVPNHEVAAVVWVPTEFLADHSNLETMEYQRAGLSLDLPCYRYKDHLIWGMTLGMVDELLSLVAF